MSSEPIVHPDGTEVWYEDGERHRADGPAIIYVDGSRPQWFLRGKNIKDSAEYQRLTGLSDADIVLFKLKYGNM